MTAAHERPEFRNAVSWTVTITFVVAGGARADTARGRAEKVAARIVSATARLAGVVEVRAVAGPSSGREEFTPLAPRRVLFDAANSGHGTYGRPDLRDRYLDPDRERALASLAEANAADSARRRADESRRRELGCVNSGRSRSDPLRLSCECVYCAPALFLAGLTRPYPEVSPHPIDRPRCVCGVDPDHPLGQRRCERHRSVRIVVVDGDPESVAEAARVDPLTADAQRGRGEGRV